MKTVRLLCSLCAILAPGALSGALFANWEEDLRGTYSSKDFSGEISSLGGSLRQVFADSGGDRFIMVLQAEAVHNLESVMLHQLYATLKGPMGKWNLSAGRVPLPWGLLTAWSPERKPFGSPYPAISISASDSGLLFNGTIDTFEYGISLTQGYGMGAIHDFPGPGLVTARAGLVPEDDLGLSTGLSVSWGTTSSQTNAHMPGDAMLEKRLVLALDMTLVLPQGTLRFEGGARYSGHTWSASLFTALEYALASWLTLEMAGHAWASAHEQVKGRVFAGFAVPVFGATLRGGYEYEKIAHADHRAVVQLHRQLAFSW
ncbi:MAG TPA: hypothetical protein PLM00_09500 [Spirochaetota bacterium]|nr:hypothetical protein [Spirochaetota bacterium]